LAEGKRIIVRLRPQTVQGSRRVATPVLLVRCPLLTGHGKL
jgi:hypothetical protein